MTTWKELYSSKEEVVLEAIGAADERGNVEWVRPLLEVVRDHPSAEVKEAASSVLGKLKVSAAEDVLGDALDDPQFESIGAEIISFLWSSGFHSEEWLPAVVRCAIRGDFRSAMEGLTWVEQVETLQGEHDLLESILLVRGALEDDSSKEIHGLLQPLLENLHRLERTQ